MPHVLRSTDAVPGSISFVVEAGQRVLRMSGEIDSTVVDDFQDRQPDPATARTAGEGHLIAAIDLTDVTFLSSAGLGFLIRETRPARQAGHVPLLRGIGRPAQQVIRIAGADGLFRQTA